MGRNSINIPRTGQDDLDRVFQRLVSEVERLLDEKDREIKRLQDKK